MKKSEAAQVFQLSRNTIDLWLKRQSETGDYQAKVNRLHRSANEIIDWHKFTEFAQKHGDKSQAEIAECGGSAEAVPSSSRLVLGREPSRVVHLRH